MTKTLFFYVIEFDFPHDKQRIVFKQSFTFYPSFVQIGFEMATDTLSHKFCNDLLPSDI